MWHKGSNEASLHLWVFGWHLRDATYGRSDINKCQVVLYTDDVRKCKKNLHFGGLCPLWNGIKTSGFSIHRHWIKLCFFSDISNCSLGHCHKTTHSRTENVFVCWIHLWTTSDPKNIVGLIFSPMFWILTQKFCGGNENRSTEIQWSQ